MDDEYYGKPTEEDVMAAHRVIAGINGLAASLRQQIAEHAKVEYLSPDMEHIDVLQEIIDDAFNDDIKEAQAIIEDSAQEDWDSYKGEVKSTYEGGVL